MMTIRQLPARLGAAAALTLALLAPAHAVINGKDTSSFAAVGAIGGASGVQITDEWVLTAAHVANAVQANLSTFASVTGATAVIDQVFVFSPGEAFPSNDIALLHLGTAMPSQSLPVINDSVLNSTRAAQLGKVTIVSAQSQTPNGYGVATAKTARTTDFEGGEVTTVNWLITQGDVAVQGGDSGGALFKGTPTDSAGAVLLGIASASISTSSGITESAFVQPAAYKSWINQTLATTGDTVTWSSSAQAIKAVQQSAVQAVVPEPSTGALSALFVAAALISPRVRRQVLQRQA
jgi:Trypsin